MHRHIIRAKNILTTGTFKDTLVLFSGNVMSAFLGFVFVFFTARFIDKSDAGIFFAVTNLAVMISSIADMGISTGIVNFISSAYAENKIQLAKEYMKAAFMIRFVIIIILSFLTMILSPVISPRLLATNDYTAGIWVGLMILAFFLWMFLPYIMQAKKNFMGAVFLDNFYMIVRLSFLFIAVYFGGATLGKIFGSYLVAGILSGVAGFAIVGIGFFKSNPTPEVYKSLFKFSGWMGLSRIASSVSGSLDVQMMAALLGALPTAIYSIPSKLASFIVVLAGSFSAVLATRLSSFGDKEKEKAYIFKSTLVTLLIVAGIIFWMIIAKPFILLLFPKYLDSVPVFRALIAANIPFMLATPAVTAVIYAMKKPQYVGLFSVFQLVVMFLLDIYLIPQFGVLGPAVTLGIINTILMIYSWTITLKHYYFKPPHI